MITMHTAAPNQTLPARALLGTSPRLPMTSARRAWLAIGVPFCLVLVGWAGLNLVALAGQGQFKVSHDIPASTGRVNVNFSSGNILLQEVAGDQAKLTGTAHYSLIRPPFTAQVTAAGTDFGYNCNLPVGNCYLNATVSVPRGTPTSVYTGGGNATAIGATGDVTLTSDGGNVSAERVSGDLTLNTGGGDVSAERVSGDLTLNTDGGDIAATAITAVRVTASSGGGNITVVFTSVPANVKVNTDGGNITIVLPPGSTHYNLTEHTDGGTTSVGVPTDSSSPNVITATSGGGNISVSQS
jgi:Putative adhesin